MKIENIYYFEVSNNIYGISEINRRISNLMDVVSIYKFCDFLLRLVCVLIEFEFIFYFIIIWKMWLNNKIK